MEAVAHVRNCGVLAVKLMIAPIYSAHLFHHADQQSSLTKTLIINQPKSAKDVSEGGSFSCSIGIAVILSGTVCFMCAIKFLTLCG